MKAYKLRNVEVRASLSEPFRSHVHLAIFSIEDGKLYALLDPDFSEMGEEATQYGPSIVIHPTIAQALMDDLWKCGFRPTEGTGSAGAIAAVQAHLEDMRKIVFDYILKGRSA